MIEVRLPQPFRKPKSKSQAAALSCPAVFLLLGGAAGSLKTSSVIEAAAQYRDNPHMHSIILRKTALELRDIKNEANLLYTQAGGRMNWSTDEYRFPSGARVWFGYAQRDPEIHKYQGPRFTFVGQDESTWQTEYRIRFMFSRLGSTDSSIPLRYWLATNPGGVSAGLHMHIFQGKICLHCIADDIASGKMSKWPEDSRRPFKLYTDATWESDKKPVWDRIQFPNVPVTTCFIPGTLRDHDLFGVGGERYSGLGALTVEMSEAYRAGCWAKFQGQYFDIWNPSIHVIPRLSVREQNWWAFWTGSDYGFKKSWACSYLFCRNPEGAIYVLDEIAENQLKARDFGQKIKSPWNERDYNVIANYLSPDSWAERGDEHTLADQMEESGIGFERASTDREGAAMLTYTMLADKKLFITDACPLLIKTIPTRIHDDKNPLDILKTPTPEDDSYDAAVRHGIYSHCREPREPREMRLAKRITSEDPTVRHIQAVLAERQLQAEEGAESEIPWNIDAPWRG